MALTVEQRAELKRIIQDRHEKLARSVQNWDEPLTRQRDDRNSASHRAAFVVPPADAPELKIAQL